jgi:HEPN family protein
MNQASVNHLICAVRQVNGMLQLLDAEKDNPSITLGELQQRFASQFGIHPTAESFYFYNQHQFLISLLAYLCMPSEKFYAELPETKIASLHSGWGTEVLFFSGSLKSLVKHLRNSVSHGHIVVTPELMFEFSNRGSVVVFNHMSLHRFCQALAYWCLTKDITLSKL